MDANEFTEHLQHLGPSDIAAVAAGLRVGHETAEGEVAWWRATVAIDGALRQHHATRSANLAAHVAAAAVLGVVERAGSDEPGRSQAIAVARAAADAARALVAAERAERVLPFCEPLLHPWYDVVTATRTAVAPVIDAA